MALRKLEQTIHRNLGPFYRTKIRPHLPRKEYRELNGVKVAGERKLFDTYLPYEYHYPNAPGKGVERPGYENGMIEAHEELTHLGDAVIIVGGGIGVTAVKAAEITTKKGSVTVYEGSEKNVQKIKNTFELNNVLDWCEVYHSIVGEGYNIYGGGEDSGDVIQSGDLPTCDVLELDCEGSELEIISELQYSPRVIIMELHPWEWNHGPEEMRTLLESSGYEIKYQCGHDGQRITDEEMLKLLKWSNKKGRKKTDSGARWPVVVGAVNNLM